METDWQLFMDDEKYYLEQGDFQILAAKLCYKSQKSYLLIPLYLKLVKSQLKEDDKSLIASFSSSLY